VIVGADRVSPLLSYTSTTTSVKNVQPNGVTVEVSNTEKDTTMALLWNGSASNIYNIPRFALDFAIVDHLTLGGSIWAYFTFGASHEAPGPNGSTVTTDQPKMTTFGFYPRIGYVINFTDVFAFWPRGGVSFNDLHVGNVPNDRNQVTTTDTVLALDLEPIFVITPIPHAGFTLGPVVDIPMLSGHTVTTTAPNGVQTSTDGSYKPFHIGLTAGLLVYF
jgi:hypothetical protein